jgi:hypothetical protein
VGSQEPEAQLPVIGPEAAPEELQQELQPGVKEGPPQQGSLAEQQQERPAVVQWLQAVLAG